MPRAAKEKSWSAGVLLAALLAGLVGGASSAEASIPREEPRGVLLEQPVPLLEQALLLEVPAGEPVDMATTGGDSFPLFAPGPGPEGLFDGVRIPALERFQAETRYRVIELEIEIRAELKRIQTPERTGLALFGGEEPRRGSPNRYYDPELGRFISADPLGYVDGPSMYGFAGYSPMNFGDPLGLACPECTQELVRDAEAKSRARERWRNFQMFKGAVVLTLQMEGWGVGTNDAQLALSNYLKGYGIPFHERITLIRALTGTGDGGVNEVAGELTNMAWFADFMESYLLNYGLAITGGEVAFAARTLVVGVRQVGLRAAVQKVGASLRPAAWGPRPYEDIVDRALSRAFREGYEEFLEESSRFVVPRETSSLSTRGFRPPPGTRIVPEGIPEGWRIRPTRGEGGAWYIDPQNPGNAVRVMPGNPNSPYPNSRVPYVRWQRNGQALDAAGNVVPSKSPGAHIPLEDFRFNPDLFQ